MWSFFYSSQSRGTKKKNQLEVGNIICDTVLAMHKDRHPYYPDWIKQKFICPFKNSKNYETYPFNHIHYFNDKRNRGCTRYITTDTDYKFSINRYSQYFKKIYSLRIESERYNSIWKNLDLEKPSVINMNSISNLNTIVHISMLSTVFPAVKNVKYEDCIKLTRSLSKLMKNSS